MFIKNKIRKKTTQKYKNFMCGGIYGKFQTNFDEILLCFATLSVHVIEFMNFFKGESAVFDFKLIFLNIFNTNY